jgi:putative membrane protein
MKIQLSNNNRLPFFIRIIISSLAILITSMLLKGVHIRDNSIFTAILIALVIAFLNVSLKPIMIMLTIPVTVFTFGLFLIVINAIIIEIADWLIDAFKVDSFWWALIFSVVLWLVTSVMEGIPQKDEDGV